MRLGKILTRLLHVLLNIQLLSSLANTVCLSGAVCVFVCAVIISTEAGSLHISRVYALHSNPLSAYPYIWVRYVLKAIEQMFFILMK